MPGPRSAPSWASSTPASTPTPGSGGGDRSTGTFRSQRQGSIPSRSEEGHFELWDPRPDRRGMGQDPVALLNSLDTGRRRAPCG